MKFAYLMIATASAVMHQSSIEHRAEEDLELLEHTLNDILNRQKHLSRDMEDDDDDDEDDLQIADDDSSSSDDDAADAKNVQLSESDDDADDEEDVQLADDAGDDDDDEDV